LIAHHKKFGYTCAVQGVEEYTFEFTEDLSMFFSLQMISVSLFFGSTHEPFNQNSGGWGCSPLVAVKKEKPLKVTTGTDVPFSAPMVSLQAASRWC
jgi:hypothetical protein